MLIARTRAARARLARLQQQLAARAEVAAAAAHDAEARAAALAAREAERSAFVDSLARERRLNAEQIASLQQAAVGGGRTLRDAHEPRGRRHGTARRGSRRRRTGAVRARSRLHRRARRADAGRLRHRLRDPRAHRERPADGWGVAAVDPAVIPLGTRFFVPGYGEAVAADVGSSVRGNKIDLWFPSHAQARAWGRRTVAIVIR